MFVEINSQQIINFYKYFSFIFSLICTTFCDFLKTVATIKNVFSETFVLFDQKNVEKPKWSEIFSVLVCAIF